MSSNPPGTPSNPDKETRVASEASPAPATILDEKYHVERVIGEGTFGRVYLATDIRLRRSVAIKELLATRNQTDPEVFQRYLDRFGREARAGGAISHPNVVTVYEMGIDRAQNTYLVMEYVDGTNLSALLNQVGNLPVERTVAVALDVAKALEAVHEHDIVHRDLKPANIMISRRGGAKLGDFGIAQVGTESQRTQIVMGHPGTPLYMSPEQASGYGYIDGRSDLYSLGLVMYEMLVGEAYGRRLIPLAQAKPETPPALVAIVERLINKDPDRRFQSATDLIAELSALSSAPQPGASTGTYSVPPLPAGSYPPSPPSQQPSSYPGAIPGVPSAYGGPPSQGTPYVYPLAPPTQPPYGGPSPYGAQQAYGGPPTYGPPPYQPPPIGPQKRRGLPAIAIIGIVIGGLFVLFLALGVIGLITGAGKATATPATSTRTGTGTAVTGAATTTAVSTFTLTTPTARTTTVSGTSTSVSASATRNATSTGTGATPIAGIGTVRPTGNAATPFPTASGTVKLAAGKPLPTAVLPQIYVDDLTRYTLHYPADWKQAAGDSDTDVQFTAQGSNLAAITTSDLNGDPKPTAQQIADQISTTFTKQLTNFKLTDATQIRVANQDGVRMLYTHTDTNNTVTLGGYLVAFSTDQTLVLFLGSAPNDKINALIPTFDNVAASFTGGITLDNFYSDPQTRFTFSYPGDWAERKPNSTAVAALVAPTAGTPSFNVVTGSTGLSLQQYYDANIKTIADPTNGLKSYKKISESDTMIADQPAKLQIYTADLGSNGVIYELHQWYIVTNGKGYVLTYSVTVDKVANFAGYGPIIASSFTIL